MVDRPAASILYVTCVVLDPDDPAVLPAQPVILDLTDELGIVREDLLALRLLDIDLGGYVHAPEIVEAVVAKHAHEGRIGVHEIALGARTVEAVGHGLEEIPEPRLALGQGLFRALALGDVLDDAIYEGRPHGRIVLNGGDDGPEKDGVVPATQLDLQGGAFGTGLKGVKKELPVPGRCIQSFHGAQADFGELGNGAVAEHPCEGRVGLHESAGMAASEDAHGEWLKMARYLLALSRRS